MTEMPMFDDPLPAELPAKKPRKPAKRGRPRKTVAVAPAPEPKKPRAVRRAPNGHAGGRYTRDQYRAIAMLLQMSDRELAAVLEIVKGLSK